MNQILSWSNKLNDQSKQEGRMFQLKLERTLRNKSKVFKRHNSDWIEIFCPFCNDATRRSNPSHGHLYFNSDIGCFKCFRCDSSGPIIKVLNEYGINDPQLFKWLASKTSRSYLLGKKVSNTREVTSSNVYDCNLQSLVQNTNIDRFNAYLYQRFSSIDPMQYNIRPTMAGDGLSFYNASNEFVTTRFIDSNIRYELPKYKVWYYFQPLHSIIEYEQILITEGAIDVINASRYITEFHNSFCIAISGNNYSGAIMTLINKYLKIGKYTINVVIDNGLKFEKRAIKQIRNCSKYNTGICIKIYKPKYGKDCSEVMLLQEEY